MQKNSPNMPLEQIILGFLSYEPMTGYDLKKRINCPVKAFWNAEHPQIYRTLRELCSEGLAEVLETSPGRNLDRKLYRITAEGTERLVSFLSNANFAESGTRNPMLMHLFFLGNLEPEEQLKIFLRYRDLLGSLEKKASDTYTRISRESLDPASREEPVRKKLAAKRIYQFAVMRRQMLLTWLDACIDDIRKSVRRIPEQE